MRLRLRAQNCPPPESAVRIILFSLPGPVVGIEKAGDVLHHHHLGCPGSQAKKGTEYFLRIYKFCSKSVKIRTFQEPKYGITIPKCWATSSRTCSFISRIRTRNYSATPTVFLYFLHQYYILYISTCCNQKGRLHLAGCRAGCWPLQCAAAPGTRGRGG